VPSRSRLPQANGGEACRALPQQCGGEGQGPEVHADVAGSHRRPHPTGVRWSGHTIRTLATARRGSSRRRTRRGAARRELLYPGEPVTLPSLADDQVKLLEKAIVRSPYGRLLGAELVEVGEDRAVVRLPYRDALATVADTVHGGAIASLVDLAATAAFWASPHVGPGARGTTIGFSLSFLAAGRGEDLLATATVRRRGREVSTGDVSVCDASGREVAAALVTYKLSAPEP
jgi:uncharacterized protein (TIGR00369 family)